MMAMPGESESITFYNESWTTEVVQLLLEVDEGWMGYYHDANWRWHEETHKTFVAICRERQWPYNSSAACKAMLQALRTSAFSIKLGNARRSSDGYAQWSLPEMLELGAQMRRVADDVTQAMPWADQFEIFKQTMRTKDLNFTIDGRTVEDFAAPRAHALEYAVNRENETYKRIRTNAVSTSDKQGRKRTIESEEGDSEYNTSQRSKETIMQFTRNTHTSCATSSSEVNVNVTSDVESGSQQNCSSGLNPMDQRQRSDPQAVGPSLSNPIPWQKQALDQQDARRSYGEPSRHTIHHQEVSPLPASSRQHQPLLRRALPREDFMDQARSRNGIWKDNTPSPRPTRKYQRVQQSTTSDRVHVDGQPSSTKSNEPRLFRNLNPYDRPGKPWGEFVVEVLLAERTAHNKDELDYVHFVRGLYEI
ncbi:hypothetical protein PsorP6_016773 [Peronosclerospora sorghi]|uniref:Uncharacterized protein n=1 Tax=Peronosclerospora sorghi TaxID=230839 RepID=A0ACC0WGA6_9STRA|nr:hypothetical protein PsorP6_016773 [Peronosclerospora sorghi]